MRLDTAAAANYSCYKRKPMVLPCEIQIPHHGEKFRILYARTPTGHPPCEVVSFLSSCAPEARRKLLAQFLFTANNGPSRNPEKFRSIQGHKCLFEFKISNHRILTSRIENAYVLLAACKKLKKNEFAQVIRRAEAALSLHLECTPTDHT